ncbi:MAG: hypothetical protein HeimAB125_16990 [Candidatus Heimdallarchaeota archaeon AB_125]|nr:MAG: hypothetical protein HeimAB125_16990 [Candidatus Heimdallarchaeota archaeon AB_125]
MKTQTKTQKLILGGFLALLVISSFVYLPISADSHDDDEDDDGVDDSYEEENEREVEIEVQEKEVQIKSSLENEDGFENEFEVNVHAEDDGLKFKLEFEEENETLETEIEFEVFLSQIIEYRDLDADGMYNESIDETVQVYQLENFNPIEYTVETVNNETVHSLFVETADEVFSATLYVSGEFADIDGIVITPTQVKIDIGIHNFNYTEDDSVLALKVKLESELEVDYEEDDETDDEIEGRSDDEYEIDVNLGEYAAFFSWIETAIIDGVEQEVKATPLEIDSEETKLYLNYPRGSEIIHDPKLGIADLLPSTAGTTGLVFIAAVALLTIPGLALLFRKKNRK